MAVAWHGSQVAGKQSDHTDTAYFLIVTYGFYKWYRTTLEGTLSAILSGKMHLQVFLAPVPTFLFLLI